MNPGRWETCYLQSCRCTFWLPESLYETADRLREKFTFYCPYGHGQHYLSGESEATKLRRERDRLAQQIAERDDTIKQIRDQRDSAERRFRAQRGVTTRIKNRVAKGVCPCCKRSFSDLARHMAGKHPNFAHPEEAHECSS